MLSVSATVPVPDGAATGVLRLRYWALDSWDWGEAARVAVDGAVVTIPTWVPEDAEVPAVDAGKADRSAEFTATLV